jgi:hypothetical protein
VNLKRFKKPTKKTLKTVLVSIGVFLIGLVIFLVLVPPIGETIMFLASLAIKNDSMLAALLQAEATFLGFFGVIVVYGLTSFDNRIDRVEQLSILTAEKNLPFEKERLVLEISGLRKKIEKERKEFFNNAFWIGVFLVISLLFSVLSFAHSQLPSSLVDILSELSILFLFVGIVYTFSMFRRLGRRRETTII